MEMFEESSYHKKKIECIRKLRNEKLQETDYVVLSDVLISEDRLTVIKNYRQELRDFVNKIMTGEIVVDWWKNDNDFVELYFPKPPV